MALFFHYLSLPYLLQGIEVTLQVTGLGLLGGLMLGCGPRVDAAQPLQAAGCVRTRIQRDLPRHAADPADGVRLRRVAAYRHQAAGHSRGRRRAGLQRSAFHLGNFARRRARRRPRPGAGGAGARHDAGRADEPHHRAAGDPRDDPRLRRRGRQRAEELVACFRHRGPGADAALDAARVLDLRFFLDIFRLRPDLSRPHRRHRRDPACGRGLARSRSQILADAADAAVAAGIASSRWTSRSKRRRTRSRTQASPSCRRAGRNSSSSIATSAPRR